MNAKLYYSASGKSAGSWVEITNTKDVTLTMEKGQTDVSTRANAGWKAMAATQKDATIEWDMVWNPSDAGFAAVKDSFLNDTVLGLAAMSEAGGEGLIADCVVTSFSRSEPLQEAITVKVQAKPTYSGSAPEWGTVGS
jgi:hypothetical protein